MYDNQEEVDNNWDTPEYLISWKLINEQKILDLSHGEVKSAETLNYRTLKPVRNGLLGENIFGPINSYECICGKYSGLLYKGVVCDRCGVELADSRVRREWLGHIDLNCRVVWPMFLKGNPSVLAIVLDISQPLLMQIVYNGYKVDVDHYWDSNKNTAVLSEKDSINPYTRYKTGIDAIYQVLLDMDLKQEIKNLEYSIDDEDGYLTIGDRHRLEVLKSFQSQNISPADMVTSKILVIPAELRPIFLHDGKIYFSEINRHYISIINRKNRLNRLMAEEATPESVLDFQKRLVQHSVNTLFDNCFYQENEKQNEGNILSYLRRNVKRVLDYSGACSVIPNGSIPLDTISLPEEMLLELYKPFIISDLERRGLSRNIRHAKKLIEWNDPCIITALLRVLKNRYILVENAQSHDLVGMKVKISTDKVAYLHPYTFKYLNLRVNKNEDVKVFVPLSDKANEELESNLSLKNNLLSYYSGSLKLIPDDITLTNVIHATHMDENEKVPKCISYGEAFLKEDYGFINKNTKLLIRRNTGSGFCYEEETTIGRILLNECLPQDMGRVNRRSLRNKYLLEFNCEFTRESFLQLLEEIYDKKGATTYLEVVAKLYRNFAGGCSGIETQEYEEVPRAKRGQSSDFLIQEYKSLFANLIFDDYSKNESELVLLERNGNELHPFIKQMLRYKHLAEDLYSNSEIIYSAGTTLTDDVLNNISKCANSLEVYRLSLTGKGNTISAMGYGERAPKTGLQSFQALRITLDCLSEVREDKNFLSILFGREPIKLSDSFMSQFHKLSVPSEIDAAFVSLLRDEQYLNLDELKRFSQRVQFLVKAYTCFILLKTADITIDFRHVELWLHIFQNPKGINIRTPLCDREDISLAMLAEFAVCGGYQSNLDNSVITQYGKINFKPSKMVPYNKPRNVIDDTEVEKVFMEDNNLDGLDDE